jgi:hypothetical protein
MWVSISRINGHRLDRRQHGRIWDPAGSAGRLADYKAPPSRFSRGRSEGVAVHHPIGATLYRKKITRVYRKMSATRLAIVPCICSKGRFGLDYSTLNQFLHLEPMERSDLPLEEEAHIVLLQIQTKTKPKAQSSLLLHGDQELSIAASGGLQLGGGSTIQLPVLGTGVDHQQPSTNHRLVFFL